MTLNKRQNQLTRLAVAALLYSLANKEKVSCQTMLAVAASALVTETEPGDVDQCDELQEILDILKGAERGTPEPQPQGPPEKPAVRPAPGGGIADP